MHALAFAARQSGDNPIAPYVWVAEYRGGGRLRQYDVDGRHTSAEIDRTRVVALVLHGHPNGPVRWALADGLGPPDAVIVRATTSVRVSADGGLERAVRVTAGYQFGSRLRALVIEDDGRVHVEDDRP